MAYTLILVRKVTIPFVIESDTAKKILADLQGRSGPVKVSEVDSDIVLDAEALVDNHHAQ